MSTPAFKRSDRLSGVIRDVLASLLREKVADPRLKSVYITDVVVPGDMHVARVYWYFLKGKTPDRIAAAEKAFVKATGLFEAALAKALHVKRIPELQFRYDEGIDQERRIEALLDGRIMPDAGASPPAAATTDEPS